MSVEDDVEIVKVEVPEPPDETLTLDGVKERLGPLLAVGVILLERLIVPVKASMLFRAIFQLAKKPRS